MITDHFPQVIFVQCLVDFKAFLYLFLIFSYRYVAVYLITIEAGLLVAVDAQKLSRSMHR